MDPDGGDCSALGRDPSFGAIFMSNMETKEECFRIKVFGLPFYQSHFVQQVKEGMILFLFEFEKRMLYGVFQACRDGAFNIAPHAFKTSGKNFPSQVKFKVMWRCRPLYEDEFRGAIKDNYYSPGKFNFGLSRQQVRRLLQLFSSRRSDYQHRNINSDRLLTQPLLKAKKNINGVIINQESEQNDRRRVGECNIIHQDQTVRDFASLKRQKFSMDGDHGSTSTLENHIKNSIDGRRYHGLEANRTGINEPVNSHEVSVIGKNAMTESRDNERALSDGNIMYMTSEYSANNTYQCHSTGCIHDNDPVHSSNGVTGTLIPEDDTIFQNTTNNTTGCDFHPHPFIDFFSEDPTNEARSVHLSNEAGQRKDCLPFFFENPGSPPPPPQQQNRNEFLYHGNKNPHQGAEEPPFNGGEEGRHGFQHLPLKKPWSPAMDVSIPHADMTHSHFHENLDDLAYLNPETCPQCSISMPQYVPDVVEEYIPYHPSEYSFYNHLTDQNAVSKLPYDQTALFSKDLPLPSGQPQHYAAHRGEIGPLEFGFLRNNSSIEASSAIEELRRPTFPSPYPHINPLHYPYLNSGGTSTAEAKHVHDHAHFISQRSGGHVGGVKYHDIEPEQRSDNIHNDMYSAQPEKRISVFSRLSAASAAAPNKNDYGKNHGRLSNDVMTGHTGSVDDVMTMLDDSRSRWVENSTKSGYENRSRWVENSTKSGYENRTRWVENNTNSESLSLPENGDEPPATVDAVSPVTDDKNESTLIVNFKRRSKLHKCDDIIIEDENKSKDVKNEESTCNRKRKLVRPSFMS